MASNYPKYLLSSVMAAKGDSTIPPATASEAGEGRLSQENGWGAETSTPLEQGGVAPRREDFNGMTLLFSQFLLWYQQGGLMNYSSKLPYEAGNEVLLNGVKYRAIQNNGGTLAAVVPGTDPTVWRNMDANVPAGAVMPFANVRLGGSDGRRPIFWGATQADEGWVLCDGGTAYGSVKAPNLIGRFIRGDTVANAGGTGGENSVTLSAAQMPKHSHTITVTTAGVHTHGRGTMDITGTGIRLQHDRNYGVMSGGAFFTTVYGGGRTDGGNGHDWCSVLNFQASRAWTGETSNAGSHTHTATCSAVGGNESGNASVSTVPPYYNLAYFVKLPEG